MISMSLKSSSFFRLSNDGPPDVDDSSGEDLCNWVKIPFVLRDGREEQVCLVNVVAGPEGIDDRR